MNFDPIIAALVDRRAECLKVLTSFMQDNSFVFELGHDQDGQTLVLAVGSHQSEQQFSFKAIKAMNSAIEKLTLKNSENVEFNDVGLTGAELVQIIKALVESSACASHKLSNIIVDSLVVRLHDMATNHEHF